MDHNLTNISQEIASSTPAINFTKPLKTVHRTGSLLGVRALLNIDADQESAKWLKLLYEPICEDGFLKISDLPNHVQRRDATELKQIADLVEWHTQSITSSPGEIAEYLEYSDADIRSLSTRLANESSLSAPMKIARAASLLGAPIPGNSESSQYARTCCAKFWRRALSSRIARAREQLFLRMALVGDKCEPYVSHMSADVRERQLKQQEIWMKNTVVVPSRSKPNSGQSNIAGEPLCLAEIAKSNDDKFAKLYTFVKAIDELGREAKLSSAMLTVTLEPEWHPNPVYGVGCWNGSSPREAHKSAGDRWQAVMRDLHGYGIRMSGFRVAEPHQDGCPHYHIWMHYRPEHESTILSVVMKYFPAKLKIRDPYRDAECHKSTDKMYDSRHDLINDIWRAPRNSKEGAQVELSKIDRSISSGAAYAMKYVMKSINVSNELKQQIGEGLDKSRKPRQEDAAHENTAKRVDAYRSVWGIHQGQLFGVAKCLTIWDEFRRMTTRPKNKFLRLLWAQSRGGRQSGRIQSGSGRRGDAKSFLKTLGGLDACRDTSKKNEHRLVLGRLVEEEENRYGDHITKTKGIKLMKKFQVQVKVKRPISGKIISVWRTHTEIVTSIKTKILTWSFKRKDGSKNIEK